MIISLATLYYDNQGFVSFNALPTSKLESYMRRITRTATLDGLSTISDMGYTASDATFEIRLNTRDQDLLENIRYLITTYPLIYLSANGGVYWGALQNLNISHEPASVQFLVKEKVV